MRYVIIGASAAGISAVEGIRERDSQGEIIMISKDKDVYSRCMLHHVISGRRDTEGISFIEKDFFKENNVQWFKGREVIHLDSNEKKLLLDGDEEVSYDKLLIASGAGAFIPPVKNLREGKEVFPLRNIEDALALSELDNNEKCVIIGAGLVGIDAAVGLLEKGIEVHIIEMGDRILPIQLDERASRAYAEKIESHGGRIHTGKALKEVSLQGDKVEGIVLDSGEKIPCSCIIVATGVRANVEFLRDSQVEMDRGILVDKYLQTSDQNIFAAGDVTGKTPIWPFAMKQGRYAGMNMVEKNKEFADEFAQRNSMNFFGMETVSMGFPQSPDHTYSEEIQSYGNVYKKIIHKDGKIYGMVFQGDIEYCGIYMQIIKNGLSISGLESRIFNIDFSDFYGIDENGEFKIKDR